MNQTTKNNILHEIREMREKKVNKFKEILKERHLSNDYLVGTKFGIEITCKEIEKIIKKY